MAFWKPGSVAPVLDRAAEREGSGFVVHNPRYRQSVSRQRRSLPIYEHRKSIMYAVEKHKTVVIIGETGCGKSTQIPQFLHEAGWTADGWMVGCTQPRRVAAVSVATRVAEEMGAKLGDEVGYMVRFDHKFDQRRTKLVYLTDGTLLRETTIDPLLSRYSVIVVDEAHERGCNSDVLLGLLKKIQRKRPALRLIVSSATMDAEKFRDYFSHQPAKRRRSRWGPSPHQTPDAVILSLQGRQYSVEVQYLLEPCVDYLAATVKAVLDINKHEKPGDVLVFLPGVEEVESVKRAIRDSAPHDPSRPTLDVMAMHGSLPVKMQMKVFSRRRRGTRRVVVATNIAETSVTLEGIAYVVDSLFVKVPIYDAETGLESLITQPVSKASATQRAGRAGRVAPGKCFRLATEAAFATLRERAVPEMQRCKLTWIVLQIKALGIRNILRFDFLAPPPAEALLRALELLFALGAIDADGELTDPLGRCMAAFPCEPQLSKMLLASYDLGCTQEAVTVAAMLSVQGIFFSPPNHTDKRVEYEAAMRAIGSKEGDHITLVNCYNEYIENCKAYDWCQENFVDHRIIRRGHEIRGQLWRYVTKFKPEGYELTSCEEDVDSLKKCIVSGFFGNAARLTHSGQYMTIRDRRVVTIHPSSSLFKLSQLPPWVIFHDCVMTSQEYIREVLKVKATWLTEIAPHYYRLQDHTNAIDESNNRLAMRKRKRSEMSKAKGKGSVIDHLRSIF